MKVDDLRTTLKKYDTNALTEIIVALYKIIPKSRKENDSLDEFLKNFSLEKKKTAKKEVSVDYPALEMEIEQLIEYANASYYLAPNRYVNKEKRSKWRFEVRRIIKELISVSGENNEGAAQMFASIYEMLSYCCNYYVFRTQDPFSAVGYNQPELLDCVLRKIFHNGVDQDSIKKAVFLTLDSNVDRETLHSELLWVLMERLKTPDAKEIALNKCVEFIETFDRYQAAKGVFRYSIKYDDYHKNKCIENTAELYLKIKLSLHEYDEGIAFFWQHYSRYNNKEITLYVLLWILGIKELHDLWISEYEKAVKKGIDPREELQEEYAKRKSIEK